MTQLMTNFKDDILAESMEGRRRYQMLTNEDGTVSFVDVTEYLQKGNEFGQAEVNAIHRELNKKFDSGNVVAPLVAEEEGYAADAKLTGDAIREVSANIYPVGAIYMSVNDTDPALLFGGEWERIEGRFLLAASEEYEAGSTGGEAKHKLTISEMPSHSHAYTVTTISKIVGGGSNNYNVRSSESTSTTGAVGGEQPHNNLPPYLTVYMWQRVG